MLQQLSEQIRVCHEHAVDAKRQADTAVDAARKADFLEMEKHWLVLARSYEFSERLGDFTENSNQKRNPNSRMRDRAAAIQRKATRDGDRDEVPELQHAQTLQEISTLLIQEDNVAA